MDKPKSVKHYRRIVPADSCLTCWYRSLIPDLGYKCLRPEGPRGELMRQYEAHMHICDRYRHHSAGAG